MVIRHDDNAARMLSCRSFDPRAALGQSVRLKFIDRPVELICKLHDITIRGLIRYSAYRASFKYVLFPKDFTNIFMCCRLVFTGKVQVDIRLLIAVKS